MTPAASTHVEPELEADVPRQRAAALPPEARRAAIVAATVPLLVAHGTNVTTRQIADAAGVAEGTIFRVFADKEAVIDAAVEAALDPAPTEAALAAIDRGLAFDAQLVRAAEILQLRVTEVWQLLSSVGRTPSSKDRRPPPELSELTRLFEPQRGVLRQEPDVAAGLLRGLVLAASHPLLITGEPLAPEAIVATLLDGLRRPAEADPARSTRKPLR